jgi:hypothetical protein
MTLEQFVILEYVDPFVDDSKLTVPVPLGTVAVIVTPVPTTSGEPGETFTIDTKLGVVPGVTL